MGKSKKKLNIFFIVLIILFCSWLGFSQIIERFPKPDFQSEYTRPAIELGKSESHILIYIDVSLLILCLSLASYFVLKGRSRSKIFVLMIFSLVYFGFFRKGCVCAVGSIQNVTYALFNSHYLIPVAIILFFIIPLIFTLFFGRTFCAAVCPLGAIQDIVIIKPVKMPQWLSQSLSIIPYIYLGLALLFSATGAGFIICQYDPFVGFFRFGANFYMIILGLSLLLLGTVVARPYCRFLCPYGVLLNWISSLSNKHAKITPDECNNCRLCEESCPFGAIIPAGENPLEVNQEKSIIKVTILLLLIPVVVTATGWAGSKLAKTLSKQHPVISLAEDVIAHNPAVDIPTEEVKAFNTTRETKDKLFERALKVKNNFYIGGWILGGFLGLIVMIKIIGLSLHKRRNLYSIDTGNCLSCARCFTYCPFELVRLGVITPDEVPDPKVKRGEF